MCWWSRSRPTHDGYVPITARRDRPPARPDRGQRGAQGRDGRAGMGTSRRGASAAGIHISRRKTRSTASRSASPADLGRGFIALLAWTRPRRRRALARRNRAPRACHSPRSAEPVLRLIYALARFPGTVPPPAPWRRRRNRAITCTPTGRLPLGHHHRDVDTGRAHQRPQPVEARDRRSSRVPSARCPAPTAPAARRRPRKVSANTARGLFGRSRRASS